MIVNSDSPSPVFVTPETSSQNPKVSLNSVLKILIFGQIIGMGDRIYLCFIQVGAKVIMVLDVNVKSL